MTCVAEEVVRNRLAVHSTIRIARLKQAGGISR